MCKSLTPTFLNRSPTMFSADIRADGVSGEVPYPVWSGDVPMEAVVAWKSDVWLVVSGFNGDPSIFNGSLFSLLLSLSLLNSNPSPGFFLSFSFTASSCRRSMQKNQHFTTRITSQNTRHFCYSHDILCCLQNNETFLFLFEISFQNNILQFKETETLEAFSPVVSSLPKSLISKIRGSLEHVYKVKNHAQGILSRHCGMLFFIYNGMLPSMRNFVRPYLNSPHRILQSLLRYHVNFHETTQKLAF